MFHKTIELTSSHVIWLQNIWFDSKFGEVLMKKFVLYFRFCFNEGLKCSVVMWFQFNLNLTLDLHEIIIKKLQVFLESGNLKCVKKFSTLQESIPDKNPNKMLPANLA